MLIERQEYRKKYISHGQLYIAGEILDFKSYDVSVKGILVEVVPANFLADISDFEALLAENNVAEIFVQDLMLTGETDIVWVKLDDEKIMLGLEFRDVIYNAEKLWRKRKFYRSTKKYAGTLLVGDQQVLFRGLNVSVDGLAMQMDVLNSDLIPGAIVKVMVDGLDVKGVGKIVWVNNHKNGSCELGMRYLTVV